MRGLLRDRLFVCLRDGHYVTRPHGCFGTWRRVKAEHKNRLVELYLCATEGTALLVVFGIYRAFFGDSTGFETMFSVGAFTFGVMIFTIQAWLLRDAPEVSAPFHKRKEMPGFKGIAPFPSLVEQGKTFIVVLSFLMAIGAIAIGFVQSERNLSIAGFAGAAEPPNSTGLAIETVVQKHPAYPSR